MLQFGGMKSLTTLILMLLSFQLLAQRLNGVVTDKSTNLPISGANVRTLYSTTFTSAIGQFNFTNTHIGDTLKISYIGYKPYYLVLDKINTDTLHIYLEQNSIQLKTVTIKGANDYKMDSILNRKAFASLFGHKSPGLKDAFITKSPDAHVPYSYNTAPNSTASIVSINLLSVIGLLNKNQAPVSKLQKVLLKDEEDGYVDHVFSKSRVSALTSLKGDSLSDFMNRYRPAIKQLKEMTDYDLILYIKKSYKEFIKNYKHEDQSLFIK